VALALSAILAACLVCLLPWIGLRLAPVLLCVSSPAHPADVIIVLGGEDGSRILETTRLFKTGMARHVIMTGENDMYLRELIQSGVPESAIWVDRLAHSTAQNAQFSIAIMREHGCQSATVVTSWYHTRRARACFRHYAPDLTFYTQPTHPTAAVARNWGSQNPYILKEYPKLLWYWLRFGISPI
jgi:uncharacterized SAM-binding protein YcdF (DUF218 family)